MSSTFYFSAWTDSDCLLGCDHQHPTVTSATACTSFAGGFVIAVEKGVLRALDDVEEAEFQKAMYGEKGELAKLASSEAVLTILLKIRIRLANQGPG